MHTLERTIVPPRVFITLCAQELRGLLGDLGVQDNVKGEVRREIVPFSSLGEKGREGLQQKDVKNAKMQGGCALFSFFFSLWSEVSNTALKVCRWWEEKGAKSALVAHLSKIGIRQKQVVPVLECLFENTCTEQCWKKEAAGAVPPNSCCCINSPLVKVQSVTWKLEAVPGPRILIYTITIKLAHPTRAPITFTCSPQVG